MEVRLLLLAVVVLVLVTGSSAAVLDVSEEEILPDYELLVLPDSDPELIVEKSSSRKKNKVKQNNITASIVPVPAVSVVAAAPPASKPPKPTKPSKPSKPPKPPTSSRGCSCEYGICTCCTGGLLDLFSQKACLKVAYSPDDFSFDMSILMNKRVMYETRVSGKNPPPACVGLPRLTGIKLCAKFSNIYFAGRNVHMCMGFEGRWDYTELFKIQFDCVRMGSEGFAVVKPEEGGGVIAGLDAVIDAGGDDIGDYDENVVRSATEDNKNSTLENSYDSV